MAWLMMLCLGLSSGRADAGEGAHDPAAPNKKAEQKDREGDPETLTVAWIGGGGASETAAVGQTPKMLYAATENIEEGANTFRKVKIKFSGDNLQTPTADYQVICTPPTMFFVGMVPIWNPTYCLGSCQPLVAGALKPFTLGASYTIPGGLHNFQLLRKNTILAGRAVNTAIATVKIAKPHGNPAASPPAAPADGGPMPSDHNTANSTNELVFTAVAHDPANGVNPTCTVACEAAATPFADKLRWEITAEQGGATAPVWHYTDATGAAATGETGQGAVPNAVYTGLFANNGHFGKRTVKLTIDLPGLAGEKDETDVELFFPRDASNNPEGVIVFHAELPAVAVPNWYY